MPHMPVFALSFKIQRGKKSFLSRVLLVSLFARQELFTAAWSAGLPDAFPTERQVQAPLPPAQPLDLPCGVENRLSRIMTLGCTPCSIRTLTASITVLPVPKRGKSEIFVFLLEELFLSQPGLPAPILVWGWTTILSCPHWSTVTSANVNYWKCLSPDEGI